MPSHSLAAARKLVLACVDCYSSASLYAEFAEKLKPDPELEIAWVLIQTHAYRGSWKHQLKAFSGAETIAWDTTDPSAVTPLADTLRARGVAAVFGGMDKGMAEASVLQKEMGFPGNDPDTRDLRTHKFAMARAAGEHGIETQLVTDIDEAMAFVDSFRQNEVTLKFDAGASGVGVEFVSKTNREFLKARILDRMKPGGRNSFDVEDALVIQPKIVGREFFANTYTHHGRTYLTGLWEYFKVRIGEVVLYFIDRALDLNGPEARTMKPILSKMNERVGQHNGPSHIEMILEDFTGNWFLIENNTRVAGVGLPAVESKLWGLSHLELYLLSVLDPERLERELQDFENRPKKLDAANFVIPAHSDGVFTAAAHRSIRELPTYSSAGEQFESDSDTKVHTSRDLRSAARMTTFYGPTADIKRDVMVALSDLIGGRLITPEANCGSAIVSAQIFAETLSRRAQEIPW